MPPTHLLLVFDLGCQKVLDAGGVADLVADIFKRSRLCSATGFLPKATLSALFATDSDCYFRQIFLRLFLGMQMGLTLSSRGKGTLLRLILFFLGNCPQMISTVSRSLIARIVGIDLGDGNVSLLF